MDKSPFPIPIVTAAPAVSTWSKQFAQASICHPEANVCEFGAYAKALELHLVASGNDRLASKNHVDIWYKDGVDFDDFVTGLSVAATTRGGAARIFTAHELLLVGDRGVIVLSPESFTSPLGSWMRTQHEGVKRSAQQTYEYEEEGYAISESTKQYARNIRRFAQENKTVVVSESCGDPCGVDCGPVQQSYLSLSYFGTTEFADLAEQVVATIRIQHMVAAPRYDKSAPLYAMIAGPMSVEVRHVTQIAKPLVSAHYSDEVLTEFHKTCQAMLGRRPAAGRIIILDGPPGTGKTSLVRALITKVGNDMDCCVVPPDMVANLGKPELLTTLLMRSGGRPLVLLLEDADRILDNRDQTNIDVISSVLNFGDGLFSDIINVWLVCTTNVPLERIDPALKRPGRLLCRIHIGELDADHASTIANSNGVETQYSGSMTLAQVWKDIVDAKDQAFSLTKEGDSSSIRNRSFRLTGR